LKPEQLPPDSTPAQPPWPWAERDGRICLPLADNPPSHPAAAKSTALQLAPPGGIAGFAGAVPGQSIGAANPATLDVPAAPITGDRRLRRARGRRWSSRRAPGAVSHPQHPCPTHTGFPTSAAGTGQHCRPGRRGHHPQPHHYPDARRPSPPRQPPHSPRRTRQLTTPTQQSSPCPHPSPQPDGDQPSLTCEAPSLGAIAGDTGPSTQPPGVGWRRRTTRASCITALHHRLRPAHPDQIIHALVTREPITVATQRRDRQGNR
jgi:hypothetical protein